MEAGGWILPALLAIAAIIGALMWWSGRLARGAEAAVPRDGELRAVRGGRIHWIARGEGPPVVMIHGLAGQLRHWSYDVIGRLEGDFRCIALDRPGCGYSERDSDALAALPEQARMIAEFLEAEGIERPLIVGHSLGGALALTLALNHPERVGALALVAPLTHPLDEAPAVFRALQIRSPLMRRAVGRTVAAPLAALTAERTLAMAFAPEPAPADFAVRGGGALGLRPEGFVAASADLAQVPASISAQAGRYDGLATPGGVLYGDGDALLDWRGQGLALTERLPHLDWRLLPGRGHMLPITAPAETAEFIRDMAARVPHAAAG